MEARGSSGRGRFVVLDGVDGCGKSTQAARLASRLESERGRAPLHVREPGSTGVGERIRALLLDRDLAPRPAVETLLFAAARRQTLEELVEPALAAGTDVVCERFHPSTFAYQAVAGELDEDGVLDLLRTWAGDPAPSLVIVIDVTPRVCAERTGAPSDRIEAKGLAFQERVARGYRRYAERVAGTVVVEGDADEDTVAARIWEEVRRHG